MVSSVYLVGHNNVNTKNIILNKAKPEQTTEPRVEEKSKGLRRLTTGLTPSYYITRVTIFANYTYETMLWHI